MTTLPVHPSSLLPAALLCCWSAAAFCAEPVAVPPPAAVAAPLADCGGALPRGDLSLADVVHLALCNNPQTREAWANARGQEAQLGINRSGYFPGISASVSTYRNSPNTNQRSLGLNVSYLLFDFGERAANLENAHQLYAAASASRDATVQTVFLSAVQAYFQVLASRAALEAATEAETAAAHSHAAAAARYQVGAATPADRLQAKTAWSQATLARISATGTLRKAEGALANLLGLPANQIIGLAPTAGTAVPQAFEDEVAALIAEAKRRRPDLAAAEAQLQASRASADAVRAAGLPKISLNASTTQLNTDGYTSHGSSMSVNVSVPLFTGYATTYRVQAAQAQAEAQQQRSEGLARQVELEVWNAYHTLLTATQTLRASADLLHSAEQAQRVAAGRYDAGVGSMLEVLNAQSALANARQQSIQARYDWSLGRAALAQAMGQLDESLLPALSPAAAPQQDMPE